MSQPRGGGAQLRALLKHDLRAHPEIERVWVDYSCMPQGDKTAAQAADFKRMLSQVNLLYLGTSVLILLDLSYLSALLDAVRGVAVDAAGDQG